MPAPKLDLLKYEDRHLISDFYLPLTQDAEAEYELSEAANFADAYAYVGAPDAKRIFDGSDPRFAKWLIDIYMKSDAQMRKRASFRLEHDGVRFRAQRSRTIDGYELALRGLQGLAYAVFVYVERMIDRIGLGLIRLGQGFGKAALSGIHNGLYSNYLAWVFAGFALVAALVLLR